MKKYIKIDWPDSQSILEYSKNVYNINDSQSIFIDENEYNIIKEYIKLDKYLKVLKDKDILYIEDKYKSNWIIVFKEYKNHKIYSYYSYYINGNEHIKSQGGVFASLQEIRLITIANDEHLKQVKDDKYLKLYLNKEESFKDGDILTYMFYNKPTIYIYCKNGGYNTSYYVAYSSTNEKFYHISTGALAGNRNDLRFATEEEKQKLFDVIKTNGYKWNDKTKTLEKLIVPKFNIADLKPFNKVLVRDNVGQKWTIDFFSFMDKDKGYPFVCVGHYVSQCIPYKGNEHLLGTTDDCDNYYKTWE